MAGSDLIWIVAGVALYVLGAFGFYQHSMVDASNGADRLPLALRLRPNLIKTISVIGAFIWLPVEILLNVLGGLNVLFGSQEERH